MRLIIAGSRRITGCDADPLVLQALHESGWQSQVTEVVSGAAQGIDAAGEAWAKYMGIPVKQFPADWTRFGPSAGPRRNVEMGAYADALVAIPCRQSKGTRGMIDIMQRLGKPVYVLEVNR